MDLSGFFPSDVHFFFTRERPDWDVLTESEMAIAEKYGTKRKSDFVTGRYCLRQCTGPMGFRGDILIGERGMPMLPQHIAASVSHSRNICGAIAGPKSTYLSLGIDIETAGRVSKEMWHLLFTTSEQKYLGSLSPDEQLLQSTVFFSLKEAYYKCQFPLTHTYLDFTEVAVRVLNQKLFVELLIEIPGPFKKGSLTEGKMTRYETEVITFCAIPGLS